jgi:hypothetical protein
MKFLTTSAAVSLKFICCSKLKATICSPPAVYSGKADVNVCLQDALIESG